MDFRDIDKALISLNIEGIDGILFDLGVSSPQLDDPHRGFSYINDAPLDMRMDSSAGLTADEIVNTWSYEALKDIFINYGEERFSAKIASGIVREREKKPVKTTLELVEIIKKAMPSAALKEKQHPAKRCFQALRIAVNDELSAINEALCKGFNLLNPEGRICVISFHSLEDRIVKSFFKNKSKGCICPPDFPVCVCGNNPDLKVITKKSITPSEDEINDNPRARSARLRIAEKL